MKVMAIVAGLAVGGFFVDSQYFHGKYFGVVQSLTQQIAAHFGIRR